MLERIARGDPAAIQEREPEKPKAGPRQRPPAALARPAAKSRSSPNPRIRAKRMRAEREAKAFVDRGEPVPAEVTGAIEKYSGHEAGRGRTSPRAGRGAGGHGGGEVLTGTMPDGTMRFPPGVGDGPKGDPNSAEKVRARRMRAERQSKELTAAGEPIPEEMAKTLYDLGSDLAPGGSIWATLAGPAGGGGAAAAPRSPAPCPMARMRFPPGIGDWRQGRPQLAGEGPRPPHARRTQASPNCKPPANPSPTTSPRRSTTSAATSRPRAASGPRSTLAAAAPPRPAAAAGKPEFPPGIGIGPKGDANSPEKVRARRMRAERKAKEALEAGQEIPADVLATINELGGTVPHGVS